MKFLDDLEVERVPVELRRKVGKLQSETLDLAIAFAIRELVPGQPWWIWQDET